MASNALLTIAEVADGIMFKSKLPDGEEMLVKQLVLYGLKELNQIVLPEGRTLVLIDISANYTASMPSDLVSIKDIYIPYENGIWSLSRNANIPIILEADVIPDGWGDYGDIIVEEGLGYNSKGGVNTQGVYIEDYANRRILFRNVSKTEFLLDYTTSGITDGGGTYIPSVAKGATEMYVMMQLALYDMLPFNKYPHYKDQYEIQKGILRFNDFNFTAFSDAVYSTITSGVRR